MPRLWASEAAGSVAADSALTIVTDVVHALMGLTTSGDDGYGIAALAFAAAAMNNAGMVAGAMNADVSEISLAAGLLESVMTPDLKTSGFRLDHSHKEPKSVFFIKAGFRGVKVGVWPPLHSSPQLCQLCQQGQDSFFHTPR